MTEAAPEKRLETFGRYYLLRPLGVGGMGALFLAYDPADRAVVVLKRMRPARESPELRLRFIDEMRVMQSLDHPHLSRMLDCGEIGDDVFITLEWIPGKDLFQLSDYLWRLRQPFPVNVAIEAARQVCGALEYAHSVPRLKFVHRDISPANVLLGWDGKARLIDYGLALSMHKKSATAAGFATGTPGFVAPEQRTFQVVDQRADVYALGAVLWFLVSGRHAYNPKDPSECPSAEHRLAELVDGIPKVLSEVLWKALRPQPGERYGTAGEMGRALEQASKELPAGLPTAAHLLSTYFIDERERLQTEIAALRLQAEQEADALRAAMPGGNSGISRRRTIQIGAATFLLVVVAGAAIIARPGRGPSTVAVPSVPSTVVPPTAPSPAPATPVPDPATLPDPEPTEKPRMNRPKTALDASTVSPAMKARLAEAKTLAVQGKQALAEEIYRDLESDPKARAFVFLGRAEVALQKGNNAAATELAAKAIQSGGGSAAHKLHAEAQRRAEAEATP